MFRRFKEIYHKPHLKVLIENFLSLSILQVLNYLLPLITLPYLARVLGVDMFGRLAIAGAIVAYFQTFVDFGFDYTSVRDVAKNQKNIPEISRIFWTVTYTKLLFIGISLLILAVFILFIPYFRNHSTLILLTFLFIPVKILFPEWLFQGMEKMKYITILNVLAKVLFTLLIFICIKERNDYIYQPLLTAGGYLISGLFSIYILFRHFKIQRYRPRFSEIKTAIREGNDIFLNLLLPNLYNNLSTLLLGYWWGNAAAGILDAAKRVISLSDQALGVLSRTFFPYLANNIKKHAYYWKISLIVSILCTVAYLGGAHIIVKLLFSKEFAGAAQIIMLLSISPILFAMMYAFGTNYLILAGKDVLVRNITIISSCIGFLLALVFIYYFKVYGAAITLLIARGLIAGLSFYYARKIMQTEGIPGLKTAQF